MKIVFTVKKEGWDTQMDPRFGRTDTFAVYNEEDESLSFVSNADTETMEHGAGLQAAKKVLQLKADILITGNGPGNKALEILKKSKVAIYIGAGDMSVREAYDAYRAGRLPKFESKA